MSTFRTFTRRLFIVANAVAVILFLLACANSFLHPGGWWLISLLGLLFPVLLLAVICGFVLFLFWPSCRRWAWVSLGALIIGVSNIHSFFAFHPGKGFVQEKPPHSVRVLTWNVRSFDEFTTRKRGASGHRLKMLDFIGQQEADVVCLQEFFESHEWRMWKGKKPPAGEVAGGAGVSGAVGSKGAKEAGGGKDPAVGKTDTVMESNIAYIQQRFHYPYYYFSRDYGRSNGPSEAGVIIFSRYPMLDSTLMRYAKPDGLKATESLVAADILVGKDTFRVFTTHLQSVLFRAKEFHDIQVIKNVDDSILQASKSIAKKLRYAFKLRADQAEAARALVDKSPYPGWLCGDFNDVPNSYTYYKMKGGWKDAWIEKGFGIGRTYVNISPTLRIDYILADPTLQVLQCRKFSLPWSDHSPVLADLQIP